MSERRTALEAALQQAEGPTSQIEALNNLAEYLVEVDTQAALKLTDEAIELATRVDDSKGLCRALLNQAWAYYNIADYSASVITTLDALKLARASHFRMLEYDALNILGSNHNVIGNHADALQCYTQALSIAAESGDTRQTIAVLNNIGQMYGQTGNHQEALAHYRQVEAVLRPNSGSSFLLSIVLVNIADTYNQLGDREKALQYAQEGIEIARRAHHAIAESFGLMQAGLAYRKAGQPAAAVDSLERALEISRESVASLQEGSVLSLIAEVYLEQGQTAQALVYFERALELFTALNTRPEIFATHEKLADAYQRMGDYAAAFYHLKYFHAIKEMVFNDQADSRQKTLQAIYEVEKARLEAETHFHRSQSLEREIQQNEQMIAELDSYADNVAHDLRNPIGVILAYGSLIEGELEDQPDSDSRMYMEELMGAANKLNEIVGALLSLAKARQQQIMPQPVDMNEVLQEALTRVRPVAEAHQAVIEIDGTLPAVMGHASWLEEAFVNYLNNAIKYGGTPPRVRLGASPDPSGHIRFWVRDNGAGLSESALAQLFTRFERLGQQKIEGHGLGLTIVKTIVEKLGGSVSAESSGIPGEGSTFSFTLLPVTVEAAEHG
ncbi:MAG: tetratricopeptide repeat-containing sensor histidine kinase [Anaerolineae bacterium]|nr:tetratricopeptide repeat-containing sensor histidine kinase [Anaerolineae bacterium]